ncbi:hypothetical protein [Aeromonas phage 85AhydR10PP]|nr:hypothetical protein [Aeromonas phage 85AhydR10PP]
MKFNTWFSTESDKKLSCSCGCGATITKQELILIVTCVRLHFRQPVTITSGHRCIAYNKRVDGASKSQHVGGNAIDFSVKGVTPDEVQKWLIANFPHVTVGRGKTFTHIDLRPNRIVFDY